MILKCTYLRDLMQVNEVNSITKKKTALEFKCGLRGLTESVFFVMLIVWRMRSRQVLVWTTWRTQNRGRA